MGLNDASSMLTPEGCAVETGVLDTLARPAKKTPVPAATIAKLTKSLRVRTALM